MAKLPQDKLLEIFNEVKSLMEPYEKGTIHARANLQGKYDLWSDKDLVDPLGKKRKEMAFAALIIQSGYVGFYYMPIYNCERIPEILGAELLKCLKGKACFHIKNTDGVIMKQIKDALKKGFAEYKRLGWV